MLPKNHQELIALAKTLIPPLSPKLHKGQAGKVCVFGGSKEYTGAPYFSSHAAALMGSDLVHLVCPDAASIPIKSYGPDLMVHPLLHEKNSQDQINKLVSSMHAIVIGPGYGRERASFESLYNIVNFVHQELNGKLPIVLDADALWFIAQNKHLSELITKFPEGQIILTPNVIEFQRIWKAYFANDNNTSLSEKGRKLANKLNCVIVQKGETDKIFWPCKCDQDISCNCNLECSEEGSLKRVGGQGDTLTGTILAMLGYAKCSQELKISNNNLKWNEQVALCCYAGACIVKECSRLAFKEKGRAMQTSDVNKLVGQAFANILE